MQLNLNRFRLAQKSEYDTALSEIKSGKKRSHWMWYIFPQYKGLGFSDTSKFYAIQDINEAKAFLEDPILGPRLREITAELLKLKENKADKIFGYPDDIKLKSCMTLFAHVDTSEDTIFKKVLDKFFDGELDAKTQKMME